MMKHRSVFNALHPTHIERERGWKPEPNPFLPKPPRPAHTFADKHIFIYANQLWYDIDATTSMLSRRNRSVFGTSLKEAPTAGIATSENDQERPLFYRWFDKYLKKAEGILKAYLMKPSGVTRDNALNEWEERDIWLRMPDYWDDTRYDSLAKAIHDYVVTGALLEYFMLTLSSKDPLTVDKSSQLTDAELDIISAANATKPGSVRKTLKPF